MKRLGMFMLGMALLFTCSSAFADPITVVVGVMEVVSAASATEAVVAGMMYVAGAMSIVGGLTQNKSLEKIGGYLGLAGGVASIATNLASSSTTLANAADSTVANTPDVVSTPVTNAATDSAGNTVLKDLNTATDATGNVANSTTVDTALNAPATAGAGVQAGPNVTTGSGAGTTDFSGASAGANPAADLAAQPSAPISSSVPTADAGTSAPNTPAGPNVNTGSGSGTTQFADSTKIPGVVDGATPPPQQGSFWKNFTDDPSGWINKNKEVVKMGGGLVQAAMQQFAPSGKDRAALMQAQLERDKFNYEKQRMANYNQSVIGASGAGIGYNPNAQPFAGGPQDPTRFVPNSAQLQIGQQWQPNQPPPGLINGSQG